MSKHVRYWKRTGDPFVDELVCPRCGANAPHQRNPDSGLRCECGDGTCFRAQADRPDLVWRSSPCRHAVCGRCGWKGTLRSATFEQKYKGARCRVSSSGWHETRYIIHFNEAPGPIVHMHTCMECGWKGHYIIDPVTQIVWEPPDQDEVKNR